MGTAKLLGTVMACLLLRFDYVHRFLVKTHTKLTTRLQKQSIRRIALILGPDNELKATGLLSKN